MRPVVSFVPSALFPNSSFLPSDRLFELLLTFGVPGSLRSRGRLPFKFSLNTSSFPEFSLFKLLLFPCKFFVSQATSSSPLESSFFDRSDAVVAASVWRLFLFLSRHVAEMIFFYFLCFVFFGRS